jgi:hypothetical protein
MIIYCRKFIGRTPFQKKKNGKSKSEVPESNQRPFDIKNDYSQMLYQLS